MGKRKVIWSLDIHDKSKLGFSRGKPGLGERQTFQAQNKFFKIQLDFTDSNYFVQVTVTSLCWCEGGGV